MKKKPIITILLFLCALALTGCVKHKIDKGEVVDKSMTPAYMSFTYIDKVMVPIIHQPVYRVSVRDKGILETFHVNAETYSSLCVGDSIWFNEHHKTP